MNESSNTEIIDVNIIKNTVKNILIDNTDKLFWKNEFHYMSMLCERHERARKNKIAPNIY